MFYDGFTGRLKKTQKTWEEGGKRRRRFLFDDILWQTQFLPQLAKYAKNCQFRM